LIIGIHGILWAELPDYPQYRKFYRFFAVDKAPLIDLKVSKTDSVLELEDSRKIGAYFLGEKAVLFNRKFGSILLKDIYGRTELVYSGIIDRLYPVLNLVGNVIWFKLIPRNFTYVHAAALSLRSNGLLLTGWPGSGKTMATLVLIKNYGASFLADDIAIVGINGYVYSNPIPLKLSKPHLKLVRKSLRDRLKLEIGTMVSKIPIIRRRVEVVSYTDFKSLFPDAQMVEKARIDYVLVLRRAARNYLRGLESKCVISMLLHQGFWERLFWIDRLFVQYSFTDSEFDIFHSVEKEREVLKHALANAEFLEIGYHPYPEDGLKLALKELGLA